MKRNPRWSGHRLRSSHPQIFSQKEKFYKHANYTNYKLYTGRYTPECLTEQKQVKHVYSSDRGK